jgi:TonB family protein
MLLYWIVIIWTSLTALFYADQPQFKGGQQNLIAFIARSMIYPEFSKQNCLQGTIQVSFKLDRDGRVSESQVQKGYGIDLDKEALRIVRLTSGKWIVPAAYDTSVSLVLPINFALNGYKCEQVPRDNINRSIAKYKAMQGLTMAIVNFYEKKSAGIYNAEDEERILQLKKELGYNQHYVDRLLRQAQSELKQGDKESACEDLNLVHGLGSNKADKLIAENCR